MGTPSVLIVADPQRVAEITGALAAPPYGAEVLASSGGDDTIDLFEARRPEVVIVTASLELGDSASLIETLRKALPRAEVQVVVIGDDEGPIRTALDAIDLAPDRFITRPLSAKALSVAVEKSLEVAALVRGQPLTNGVIIAPPSATTLTGVRTNDGTDPALMAGPGPFSAETRPYPVISPVDDGPTSANTTTRAQLRARWEALADSIGEGPDEVIELEGSDAIVEVIEVHEEPAPLPPPVVIQPRKRSNPDVDGVQTWKPGNTAELREEEVIAPPVREPTLILRDEPPPVPVVAPATGSGAHEIVPDHAKSAPPPRATVPPPLPSRVFDEAPLTAETTREPSAPIEVAPPSVAPLVDAEPPPEPPPESGGRDFARQLRAKMSMMAQRLFQGDAAAPPAVDMRPLHDHQTEIDLAALADEPVLGGGGVTEIERVRSDVREVVQPTTNPGSWDTQIRERGVPDHGEIVRGVSDVGQLLARMFAQNATGRVGFRREAIEKVVFFDSGRPVFASSNEPGDRMAELLVREGKITAAQYERCQSVVAASGRRMGEILVDFGYLKRRELLPAVRRHVEDIIFSLFGWDRGHYHITIEPTPSTERIRLSRHPASLVLEGIRRKLDRSTLDRLLGPPSTVIEVPDRDRLGGIISTGDLSGEERAAIAAFDGQADLAHAARAAGLDVADVLPIAWGLCVLGLATARRTEVEAHEESSALVGETDLAIDRERVRARWQLVTEADYFALLGVRRDATAFEIRRAYQAARRDFAADCFPPDLRRELARELDDIASVLDEAFRVLRDDRLRVTYLANLVG